VERKTTKSTVVNIPTVIINVIVIAFIYLKTVLLKDIAIGGWVLPE